MVNKKFFNSTVRYAHITAAQRKMKIVSVTFFIISLSLLTGCGVSKKEFEALKKERDALAVAHKELQDKIQKYDSIMLLNQVNPKVQMIERLISEGGIAQAKAELDKLKRDFPTLVRNEKIDNLESKILRALEIEAQKPDFIMSATDFLALTWDSNTARARQLYHNKRVRLNSTISSIGDRAVFLVVTNGSNLMASLSDTAESELKYALPMLEEGMSVVAEGIFNLEHRWIEESSLLHPNTLAPLDTNNVLTLRNPTKEAQVAAKVAEEEAERKWAEYSAPFQRITWARLASGLISSKPGDKFVIKGRVTRVRGDDEYLNFDITDTNGDKFSKVPNIKRGKAEQLINRLYENRGFADFYIVMTTSSSYGDPDNWPEVVNIRTLE